MSLKNIKLIVADLDGTLLHDDKSLDRNIKSVLIEKNVPLTFVSGRNVHIIQDYIKELNISLPYITNNGANMFLGNTCIYECPIDSSELKTCLKILVANKVAFLAYTNQIIYSVGYQEGLDTFKNRLIGKCKIVENANIEDIVSESIFKVVMIHPNMEKIKNQLNSVCDKTLCMQSEGIIYTLTNKDSTKGKTLLKLLKYLDMEPSSVLAFGDNYNDISMFEVRGGGRKPWRQKGTGHARQGSTRSPQWTGGGVVFAPTPRDYSFKLNKKEKRAALKSALTSRVVENKFVVVDELKLDEIKTKKFVEVLKNLNVEKALVVLNDMDEKVIASAANIPTVKTTQTNELNVFDVLKYDTVVVTKAAVATIEEVYA